MIRGGNRRAVTAGGALAAFGLVGALLLVACGGDDDAAAPPTEPPPVVTTTPATAPPTTSTTTVPVTVAATTVAPTTVPPATSAPSTVPASTAPPTTHPVVQGAAPPPAAPPAPVALTSAGRISIPAIALDAPMFDWDFASLKQLDYGPGQYSYGSQPGQVGNVTVGAHRTSKNHEFRYLELLEPGHQIIVTDEFGSAFTYEVEQTFIVQPTDTWILNHREGATITLFACHPLGSTRERIIVYGNLIA